jgi:hypothetical protein
MRTSAILITLTIVTSLNIAAHAQKPSTKAGLIEQNFVFELTDTTFSDRSKQVNATLQYYVNNPDLDRVAIVETLLKLVRCDNSKETRFAALLAVTVLNDEHLIDHLANMKSSNLDEFSKIVSQEVGSRYFANITIK